MKTTSEQVILAIDPGFDRCGVAIIRVGTTTDMLHSLCIQTNKKETHAQRLAQIYRTLEEVIAQWQPDTIAVETLFFSVNKTSAMAVAQARGVVVLLAGLHDLPLIELSPQEVKQGMTGSGNADKKAVQKMVELTLKIDISKRLDDEIDAIALGMAAAGTLRLKNFL